MEDKRRSILEMIDGAVLERADYEMARIMDNILDVNTPATKPRKLIITFTFSPDAERRHIPFEGAVESKLVATNSVGSSLYVTADSNGEAAAVEMVPQIPGQRAFDGTEQKEPPVLRMVK